MGALLYSDDCQDSLLINSGRILAFSLLKCERPMVDKEQIQKHLSLSSDIKLSPSTPDAKGDAERKARIMEHVQRSKGQR